MHKYFKKYEIDAFHNSIMRRENAKKANITNKRNKTGFWNPKTGGIGGRASAIMNKKRGKGLYDPKIRKLGVKANKKNRTGLYDIKIRSMGNKKGGLKTAEILRHKRNIKKFNLCFDSYRELEIGMNIHYQLNKLIENKSFQIRIGNKIYDFLIPKYKTFIEYHPIINFLYHNDNNKNYYMRRRLNLNNNGYKDYNLIVIK